MQENIFSEELRKALVCISDETRQLIISKLVNDTECSYTELGEDLQISKGNLSHHLSELQKAGIVMNYSKKKLGSPYESYYSMGDFGKDLVTGIFNALQPSISASKLSSLQMWSASVTKPISEQRGYLDLLYERGILQ